MAYQPFYSPTDWQNLPSQKTALNRTNLLHAENGIKEADNRIVQLDAKKAEQAVVNAMVKDVVLDDKTGVLTVTLLNGTTKSFDLDIERVVTNFDITDDNELVLTLADGTRKTIDLTRFVYSVASTDTVAMEIKDRVMRAVVVDGSITMEKLDTAIQSEFRQYMIDAQTARDAALQYQKFAKRYAIGDAEFEGSDTDNAKYYYEQSATNASESITNAQVATQGAETATAQATIATSKATNAAASANNAAADAQIATDKASIATQMAQAAVEEAGAAERSKTVAETEANEAIESARQSRRYAVGGVLEGDEEDNSKWYCERAQNYARLAQEVTDIIYPDIFVDLDSGHLMAIGGNNFSVSIDNNGHLISAIGSGDAA